MHFFRQIETSRALMCFQALIIMKKVRFQSHSAFVFYQVFHFCTNVFSSFCFYSVEQRTLPVNYFSDRFIKVYSWLFSIKIESWTVFKRRSILNSIQLSRPIGYRPYRTVKNARNMKSNSRAKLRHLEGIFKL